MRIERRKIITVELTREEAIALRRALEPPEGQTVVGWHADEDAKRVASELHTGLGQNLYELRENYA